MRTLKKLALILAAASPLAHGDEPLDLLTWRQPVLGPFTSGQVFRILITPEVFNGCRSFPADIRITDEARRTWPFFLWTPQVREENAAHFATLGRRTQAGGGIFLQEVFIRADDERRPPAHNQLSVLMEGRNFVRRVEVLGSADGTNWRELGAGHLVDDQQMAVRVSNRFIRYEETTVSRLMLRIHPAVGRESEPDGVLDVQVTLHHATTQTLTEVALAPIAIQASEVQNGVMTLAYDAGAQNRTLEHIRMKVGAGDFVLPVKIHGRNDPVLPWRWIVDGGIYRLGESERDTLALPPDAAQYRQYKLDLHHGSRKLPPITAVIAEAQPQYLVVEARGGLQPVLHYGAEKIPLPRYDLQRKITPERIAATPVFELGVAQSNPLKVASGLSAYIRTMALVVGTIAALTLLVFGLRFLRSRLW